ncbi:MAG: FAD-dependent oxidoreductase [Pseudomonadota bacterium]
MQNLDSRFSTLTLGAALEERCELVGAGSIQNDGEWVLYWMHHAMRVDENPAIEVGITCARALDKPLLVYQGLGGGHAYDSDRSHTFILQGARDVAKALQARGITYAFSLPEAGTDSPLASLAARAALVVAEHMPVAPLVRWQKVLATRTEAAILKVDARCIVPMSFLDQAPARAFKFKDKTKHEFRQRIPAGWPALPDWRVMTAEQDVFEPLDIANMSDTDIAAAIERQPIDHRIGPVLDTPGGTEAGYRRWNAFCERGLASYHRKRNDAALQWPIGVSRMSPYLHYGMVSPFRLAKEAAELNLPGSEKFIEELTIWRELAHHFCAHCKDPDSLSALPGWAQETLEEHAKDPRTESYSMDTLARARSGHELWDLAQRSLLVHGELHNNLRMTWAKALVEWRESPQSALDALLELNHRYALDGNDPSSYGGLLWALGLFDRPFDPPQPVLGTIRPRSVAAHAKRLDMPQYAAHVNRTQGERLRIAVIGAGIAGMTAAAALTDQNHDVVVFEKSRGPGGRTATRRADDLRFDHGAQYATASDRRFEAQLQAWEEAGVVRKWPGEIHDLATRTNRSRKTRWQGTMGMNAICKHLAEGIDLRRACRITALERVDAGWRLCDELDALPERERIFDNVIVTAPAPQAADLLDPVHHGFAQMAKGITYDPCWALMAVTKANTSPSWRGAFSDSNILSWLAAHALDNGHQQCVVHATPEWSRQHLEDADEAVVGLLTEALRETSEVGSIVSANVHRWRYARVVNPDSRGALFDAEAGLAVAGDWLGGGAKIESAWLSGCAAAGLILRSRLSAA